MKANELMIGDWIQYGNRRVMVVGFDIRSQIISYLFGDEAFSPKALIEGTEYLIQAANDTDFYSLPEADIVPIPLTPEILEKNGIHLEEVGDNGTATPAKWRNRFEKWSIKTTWKDAALWYDRTAKYWHLHDMGGAKIHFVHELEHALRLAGIEKEVTL